MPTVIKHQEVTRLTHRPAAWSLADHLAEANALVARAQREADRIRTEAERTAAELRERSHQEAYEKGYAEGRAEGERAGYQAAHDEALERFTHEQDQLVAALTAALHSFEQMKGDLRLAAERDVLEFAVKVAERLTCGIGTLHRDAARANLQRALQLVEAQSNVTISANPADLATLEVFATSATGQLNLSTVTVVGDESIAPGGCRVSTPVSEIDATIETQIEELVAILLGQDREEHAAAPAADGATAAPVQPQDPPAAEAETAP